MQQQIKSNIRSERAASSNHKSDPNLLWLCGKHAVQTALIQKRRKIFQILLTKNSVQSFDIFFARNPAISQLKSLIKIVENIHIEELVGRGQVHQGIAVQCSKLPTKNQHDLLSELYGLEQEDLPNLLLLDQISDPHNVGAIIRSAVAFGVKKIIFLEHNSPKENATIVKSSAGTIDFADLIVVTNFSNLMEKLKKIGYWCVGLDGAGTQSIKDLIGYKHIALIVGSEGNGIRDLVKKNCDLLAKIEIGEAAESLNASVAAAITLYELARK